MYDFRKLIRRMGIRRRYILLLLLRSPFDALRTWMLANLMKSVFFCLEMEDSVLLFKICVIYGLICGMLFLYNGTIWSSYAAFSARVEARLQKEMLDRILGLPLRRVESRFSGEWITKLNSDLQAVFMMMNGPMNLPHLVVAVINTVLSSFLIFRKNTVLSGVTWIFILPQLWMNYKAVLAVIPGWKQKAQNAMAENTSALRPLIADAEAILLYGAGDMMMEKYCESSRNRMRINMKIHVRNALGEACMRLFGIGGYFAVLLVGYGLIYRGIMAFSDVVYCFQVRGSVLGGIFMLATCLNNLKANSVCAKRINDVLDE